MRTIIAGSREVTDYTILLKVMTLVPWVPTVVLSGCARGVDRMGELWAKYNDVPLDPYPAKWRLSGGVIDYEAGKKRNTEMAENADALVCIWDGSSTGSRHMIETAYVKRLAIYLWRVDKGRGAYRAPGIVS